MTDIIEKAQELAALNVPWMRAEVTVHEDEDPRYTDDCLVQIIEKDDENSIWYEEEHGGYEHGKLHFAHVFAAAPELAQALAEETYEYAVQVKCTASKEWRLLSFKLPFITHKTTWFRSQSEAEHQRQEQVSEQVNSRIVRRRVSPPEVIND